MSVDSVSDRLLAPFSVNPFQFQLPLDMQERLQQVEAWRRQEEALYPAGFGRRKSSADDGLVPLRSMQVSTVSVRC